MSYEQKEPVEICRCAVCDGEIYEGEVVWSDGHEMICEIHLDDLTAQHFGFFKTDGDES